MRFQLPILLLTTLTIAGCGRSNYQETANVAQPRLVSIEVEVYDPITNLIWENVSVRVVEADNEWSGCTCVSPYLDWYLTDSFGRVLLDEYVIADADVGFLVDGLGAAVLGPLLDEDEAVVVLEIDAVGFVPVIIEVPISWSEPDVFVEVPFF